MYQRYKSLTKHLLESPYSLPTYPFQVHPNPHELFVVLLYMLLKSTLSWPEVCFIDTLYLKSFCVQETKLCGQNTVTYFLEERIPYLTNLARIVGCEYWPTNTLSY